MKVFSYEELVEFIEKELASSPNERIVLCYSKTNKDDIRKFIIAPDDMLITKPWQCIPQQISKGDYIHADLNDIYGIEKVIFKCCFTEV